MWSPNAAAVVAAPRPGVGIAEARKVVESLGGRVTGDGQAEDLEILLPRR